MPALTLLTASLFLASCSKPAEAGHDAGSSAAPEVETLGLLRESARELLDANCGECHTRGLPTALPRALAVYDLTELDWSHSMSDAQLREAERRLRAPVAPTRGEAEVRPIHASDAALGRFQRYVQLETERRAALR